MTTFKHLVPGNTYRVVRQFIDYDGQTHGAGEAWTFLRSSFLPHDDGLSLFVLADGRQHQIRLQWREGAQGSIIDQLGDFVIAA